MELTSAIRIGNQLIAKIQPACNTALLTGEIEKGTPQIKKVEITIKPSNRKLLDALLLECSTPISTSNTKLVRLYQNVPVIIYLA